MEIRKDTQGVALLTVITFLFILTSLAATALFIMTGTTFLATHQFERAIAYYVAEAGMVYNYERLSKGLPGDQDLPLSVNGKLYTAEVDYNSSTGQLESTVKY